MGLFGKKKLSVDEILAAIENLSEDEQSRLKFSLGGADEEPAEEPTEAPAEETDGAESEDPTPTTEPTEPEAEPAPAEDAEAPTAEPEVAEHGEEAPAEEAPPAEPAKEAAEEPENGVASDDIAQIRAEVAKLTETVTALAARLDADAENNETDEKEPFGLAAGANGHEAPVEDELEAARKKHWNF